MALDSLAPYANMPIARVIGETASYDLLKTEYQDSWAMLGKTQADITTFLATHIDSELMSSISLRFSGPGPFEKPWFKDTVVDGPEATVFIRYNDIVRFYLSERGDTTLAVKVADEIEQDRQKRFMKQRNYCRTRVILDKILGDQKVLLRRGRIMDDDKISPDTPPDKLVSRKEDGMKEDIAVWDTLGNESGYKTYKDFTGQWRKVGHRATAVAPNSKFKDPGFNPAIMEQSWCDDLTEVIKMETGPSNPLREAHMYNPLAATTVAPNAEDQFPSYRIGTTNFQFIPYMEQDITGAPSVMHTQLEQDPTRPDNWLVPRCVYSKGTNWHCMVHEFLPYFIDNKFAEYGYYLATHISGGTAIRSPGKSQGILWESIPKTLTKDMNLYALRPSRIERKVLDEYYEKLNKNNMKAHKLAAQLIDNEKDAIRDKMRSKGSNIREEDIIMLKNEGL